MDIRDLVVEDELFDPFEDEEEDAEQFAEGEEPETPLVGEPLEQREEPEEDTRPPRQRIYELLGQMPPGQKRVLLSIVDFCREEKTGEEMDAFTEELQVNSYSVYTPVILRELLQKAGAIEYKVEEDALAEEAGEGLSGADADSAGAHAASQDGADADRAALDSADTHAGDAASQESAVLSLGDEPKAADAQSAVPGAAFVAAAAGMEPADNADGAVLVEHWESDGEDIHVEYLEIEEQAPGVWQATPEGLEVVDEQDDFGQIQRLLGKEPEYTSIYERILGFCKEEGRSAKELDNLVNDDPLLEEPRRYSGYFVGRLEREGAITWANGWTITEDGARILESLAQEAAAAAGLA